MSTFVWAFMTAEPDATLVGVFDSVEAFVEDLQAYVTTTDVTVRRSTYSDAIIERKHGVYVTEYYGIKIEKGLTYGIP